MAKQSTLSVEYSLSGDGFTGSPPLWVTALINSQSSPPVSQQLLAGFAQVAVPPTATGVLIVWATGSTFAKTLKGLAGDTGQPVGPTGFVAFSFAAGSVPSLGIGCTGSEQCLIFWS